MRADNAWRKSGSAGGIHDSSDRSVGSVIMQCGPNVFIQGLYCVQSRNVQGFKMRVRTGAHDVTDCFRVLAADGAQSLIVDWGVGRSMRGMACFMDPGSSLREGAKTDVKDIFDHGERA